jgi:hypothetical protein
VRKDRTDMTKLIIACRNFANTLKNRIATNSVMCTVQQICQTGQISKDTMSVGHGMCPEILNISKILLGKIKKKGRFGSPKFENVIKVNF